MASEQQCPMMQEEPWWLSRWPTFMSGRFGLHREVKLDHRQPILPSGEVENGTRFRLMGENHAFCCVSRVFAMLAAGAGLTVIHRRMV